jgi:hypothetical protein
MSYLLSPTGYLLSIGDNFLLKLTHPEFSFLHPSGENLATVGFSKKHSHINVLFVCLNHTLLGTNWRPSNGRSSPIFYIQLWET